MAVCSDNTAKWGWDSARKFNLKKYIDYFIFSYRVGVLKPNKKMYTAALKKLKLKPNETVFIDNNLTNVKAARKLGIHAIHFTTAKKVENKLNEMRVL